MTKIRCNDHLIANSKSQYNLFFDNELRMFRSQETFLSVWHFYLLTLTHKCTSPWGSISALWKSQLSFQQLMISSHVNTQERKFFLQKYKGSPLHEEPCEMPYIKCHSLIKRPDQHLLKELVFWFEVFLFSFLQDYKQGHSIQTLIAQVDELNRKWF